MTKIRNFVYIFSIWENWYVEVQSEWEPYHRNMKTEKYVSYVNKKKLTEYICIHPSFVHNAREKWSRRKQTIPNINFLSNN